MRLKALSPGTGTPNINDYLLRLNELNTILSVEQSDHYQGIPDNDASPADHLENMEMFAIEEGEWELEQ